MIDLGGTTSLNQDEWLMNCARNHDPMGFIKSYANGGKLPAGMLELANKMISGKYKNTTEYYHLLMDALKHIDEVEQFDGDL